MRRFHQLFSIARLKARRAKGQVATMMLLFIIVVLVLALVTANMGHMSTTTTNVANAADSASLLLASQLATKSHQLWDSLKGDPNDGVGATKRCKSSGFLGIIFAVVLAVIGTIIFPGVGTAIGAWFGASGTLALAIGGAVLGAVGSVIGNVIAGAPITAFSVIQGALIGFAIGSAAGTFGAAGTGETVGGGGIAGEGGAMTTSAAPEALATGGTIPGAANAPVTFVAGSEGATIAGYGALTPGMGASFTAPMTITAGSGMFVPAASVSLVASGGAVAAGATVLGGSVIVPGSLGFIAGGALVGASNIVSAYISDQITADQFAAVAKALSGLPTERERYRQSTIFDAFSRTIDDPKREADAADIDGDGDVTELVPHFLVWWDDRINEIKNGTTVPAQLVTMINQYKDGALKTFRDKLEVTYLPYLPVNSTPPAGMLCRQEITGWGGSEAMSGEGTNSTLLQVLNRLESSSSWNFPWWEPGPSNIDLENFVNTSCGVDPLNPEEQTVCGPTPLGYDELDGVNFYVRGMVQEIDEIRAQPGASLASSWESWVEWLYNVEDPSDPETMYNELNELINGSPNFGVGLNEWKNQIMTARNSLPTCTLGFGGICGGSGICYTNSPCKSGSNNGSADADTCLEFQGSSANCPGAIPRITTLVNDIEVFRTATQTFAQDFAAAVAVYPPGVEINPVTYPWKTLGQNDVEEDHSIRVEVGNFKVPKIKSKKSFTKVCLILKDYKDPTGSRTWVDIERTDPNPNMGIWRWNPWGGQIHKRGRAGFSYNYVKLAGTN